MLVDGSGAFLLLDREWISDFYEFLESICI